MASRQVLGKLHDELLRDNAVREKIGGRRFKKGFNDFDYAAADINGFKLKYFSMRLCQNRRIFYFALSIILRKT